MMTLVTVSALFLRWLPHHGLPILMLFAISTTAAGAIYLTQRRRYSASARGIRSGNVNADTSAVLWTAFAGVALGALGIAVVLAA
nr:hypothetical protein [Arthrobacter sp. ISL-48]